MKKKICNTVLIGSLLLGLTFYHQKEVRRYENNLKELDNKYQILLEKNKNLQEQSIKLQKENENIKQQIEDYKKKLSNKNVPHQPSRGGQNYIIHKYTIYSDITKPSGITSEQLYSALEGTKLQKYANVFIEAEQRYGVNAVFLTSLAALESGWGTSEFARVRNNLFGFQSYDKDLNKTAKFSSKTECIYFVAKYLQQQYLSTEGKHYTGVRIIDINKKYSTSEEWKNKIVSIMNTLVKNIE